MFGTPFQTPILVDPALHTILAVSFLAMPDWYKCLRRDLAIATVDPLLIDHIEQMAVALHLTCDGLLEASRPTSHMLPC